MVNVHKISDTDKLAFELGEFILAQQDAALQTDPQAHFNIAISGGSLINVLYKCLVQDAKLASRVKWSNWFIYFCDERIVPSNHEDSNYGAFKKAVLDKLSSQSDRGPTVFTINESLVGSGPAGNQKIAQEYEGLLPKENFHLLLLGCGPDGHTCSLFPNKEHRYLLEETQRKVMWCHDSPKPPSDRITFTLPIISKTKSIAFVAEGESKQDVMHQIFDLKNTELPTALINKLYGDRVSWYVNDAAFAKVETNDF